MVTFYNADGTSTNYVATNNGGSGAFQLIYQHLDFGGTTGPFFDRRLRHRRRVDRALRVASRG